MEDGPLKIGPVTITGTITIEHLLDNGTPARKATHPGATATLCRNEFRDVLLNVHFGGRGLVLPLRNAKIHRRFAKEGKMSIVLPDKKVNLFFSNCPPNNLFTFLKFLAVKNASAEPSVGARQRLLSDKPKDIQEISPLALRDSNGAQISSQKRPLSGTTTTPPGKRKNPAGDKPKVCFTATLCSSGISNDETSVSKIHIFLL